MSVNNLFYKGNDVQYGGGFPKRLSFVLFLGKKTNYIRE